MTTSPGDENELFGDPRVKDSTRECVLFGGPFHVSFPAEQQENQRQRERSSSPVQFSDEFPLSSLFVGCILQGGKLTRATALNRYPGLRSKSRLPNAELFSPFRASLCFHLVKNILYFPLLVLRGIYHYWNVCPGDLRKWRFVAEFYSRAKAFGFFGECDPSGINRSSSPPLSLAPPPRLFIKQWS